MKWINKIATDSLVLYSVEVLKRIRGIVIIPLFIFWIGLDQYGAFIQIIINVSLLSSFAQLGLGDGFYRFTSSKKNKTEISEDLFSILGFTVLLATAWGLVNFILSPLLSKFLLRGFSVNSVRISSILIITSTTYVSLTKFIQSRKQFKYYALFDSLYSILPYFGLVAGIGVLRELFWGLVGYIFIQLIILTLLFRVALRKTVLIAPKLRTVNKFLRYSWPLMFSNLAGGILSKIDRYFIGYFLGPSAIGIYNIAYTGCSFLDSYTVPMRKYLAIYLPALWDEGKVKLVKNQVKQSLLYFMSLAGGTLVGILFLFPPFLGIVLNKNLMEFRNFEVLVGIIGLGIILMGISRFLFQIVRYQERTHIRLLCLGISAGLNVILNAVFIPTYGIVGAGVATLLSYLALVILADRSVHLNLDKNFYYKFIKIIATSLVLALVLFSLPKYTITFFIITSSIGMFAYLGLQYGAGIITLQDLKRLAVVNEQSSKD